MMYASKRREIDLFIVAYVLEQIAWCTDLIACTLSGVNNEEVFTIAT